MDKLMDRGRTVQDGSEKQQARLANALILSAVSPHNPSESTLLEGSLYNKRHAVAAVATQD